MKAPNEKLIELLFTRHSLQICGAKTTLYAPSSREEYNKGYDAMFMGRDGCRELYLQFKTPNVRSDGLFTISISRHQHLRLLQYPQGASFYVSHTFKSIREIQDCQLRITNSKKILKYFIVIEAHAITAN